jgi:hypothetical protein
MVKLELVLEPDEADLILRALDRAREVHAEQAESGGVSAETLRMRAGGRLPQPDENPHPADAMAPNRAVYTERSSSAMKP